jgi:two-component SAPR family response regulator
MKHKESFAKNKPDRRTNANMLKAIIVDDEKLGLDLLSKMLEEYTDFELVGAYTNSIEALDAISRHAPHAVFLDIEMPGINGMELANLMLANNPDIDIVFVTAYSEYALQAFRVNAIDYILKPVRPDEIKRCAEKITKRNQRLAAVNPTGQRPSMICLGNFEVYHNASNPVEPIRFPTSKVEELLAFMLINWNSYVSKWTICEHLWPANKPEKAEQNLHTTVYRLKKTLIENGIDLQLEHQKGSYCLKGSCTSDYLEFEQLTCRYGEGTAIPVKEMEVIVSLYKGQLFSGKDYSWCEGERERLQRLFAHVSKRLASAYSESGEHQIALEVLYSLLAKMPYDEEGHELLLRTYLLLQDRISFVVHYNKYKDILINDLGLEPRAEIKQLFDSIND